MMTEFTFLDELYFYVSTVNPQRPTVANAEYMLFSLNMGQQMLTLGLS